MDSQDLSFKIVNTKSIYLIIKAFVIFYNIMY